MRTQKLKVGKLTQPLVMMSRSEFSPLTLDAVPMRVVLDESERESHSGLPICYPVDSTVHGILQARILEWVAFPFSRASFQPRDWGQVSHIVGGLFTSWATRKSKNTQVGSLSLLRRIFTTQESNWDLLHCRQIVYQLRYEGSPGLDSGPPNVCLNQLHQDHLSSCENWSSRAPPWSTDSSTLGPGPSALSFNKPSDGPEAHSGLRLQFISANHPSLSLSPSDSLAKLFLREHHFNHIPLCPET